MFHTYGTSNGNEHKNIKFIFTNSMYGSTGNIRTSFSSEKINFCSILDIQHNSTASISTSIEQVGSPVNINARGGHLQFKIIPTYAIYKSLFPKLIPPGIAPRISSSNVHSARQWTTGVITVHPTTHHNSFVIMGMSATGLYRRRR